MKFLSDKIGKEVIVKDTHYGWVSGKLEEIEGSAYRLKQKNTQRLFLFQDIEELLICEDKN